MDQTGDNRVTASIPCHVQDELNLDKQETGDQYCNNKINQENHQQGDHDQQNQGHCDQHVEEHCIEQPKRREEEIEIKKNNTFDDTNSRHCHDRNDGIDGVSTNDALLERIHIDNELTNDEISANLGNRHETNTRSIVTPTMDQVKTKSEHEPCVNQESFKEESGFDSSGKDASISELQKLSDNLSCPQNATEMNAIEMTSVENGSAEGDETDKKVSGNVDGHEKGNEEVEKQRTVEDEDEKQIIEGCQRSDDEEEQGNVEDEEQINEGCQRNDKEPKRNEDDLKVALEANSTGRHYKRNSSSSSVNAALMKGRRRHGGPNVNVPRNETGLRVLEPESNLLSCIEKPHDLFIELHQLEYSDSQGIIWKERARWIKFEEDIEEGSDRWGKPHVASLTFHSLLELKRGLQDQGVVMLDCKFIDLSEIFESIGKQLFNSGLVTVDGRKKVMQMLTQKVLELYNNRGNMKSRKPRRHSYPIDPRHGRERRGSAFHRLSTRGHDRHLQAFNGDYTSVPITVDFGQPAHTHKESKEGIMRKIPEDSEAAMVMVACDDTQTLDKSVMALVRLTNPTVFQGFTEVPIPLRFLFVTICLSHERDTYFEIGRSLSTLLSDPHFCKSAYRATSCRSILQGIDEFLDRTMVLPPGEWDRELLEPILRHREKTVHAQNKARSERFSSARLSESDIASLLEKQRQKEEAGSSFLKRTGKLFGGLVNEVKQRYPLFVSDVKDGLNVQCLISFMCLYFACLAPAIAFGGLLGEKTNDLLGVSEMIISTGLCGMIFALFAGQPLIIIGATGPMLVFEEYLYKFCKTLDVDFLTWRVWIGVWIFLIAVMVVAVEGSALIHYFTRFTEEIFATLISLIFIYETYKSLYHVMELNPFMMEYCSSSSVDCNVSYEIVEEIVVFGDSHHEPTALPTDYHLKPTHKTPDDKSYSHDSYDKDNARHTHDPYPNTTLLSIILTLGTFLVAYFLRDFKNSTFLGRSARRIIGDFSIAIAIMLMVLLDYGINNIYTDKLHVTSHLRDGRPLVIDPLGKDITVTMIFAAAIPAFMVFILLYIEILLTGVVVNKKENKLKKGSGYHLDLFVMGVLSFICGFMGLPWMCAATVRTVSHVGSVSTFTHTSAPGVKPKLERIKEQRITGFMVSFLIGCSVFMKPILGAVPLAVVYGVFIYLGFCSLSSLQFISRLKILFMPSKYHPDVSYVRMVKTWRIHMFTIIQFLCLVGLWVVKMSPVAIAFPFFLMLLVPVRHFLKKFVYSEREINALDSEEEEKDEGNFDEHF